MSDPVLGDYVYDQVSGFSGIVVGTCTYLTGPKQLCVQPICQEGTSKMPEAQWFDAQRVKFDQEGPILAMPKGSRNWSV